MGNHQTGSSELEMSEERGGEGGGRGDTWLFTKESLRSTSFTVFLVGCRLEGAVDGHPILSSSRDSQKCLQEPHLLSSKSLS